ncbi:MAG: rhodanese-like domain-containing protein [Hyphomicrobiaceae bacterium]|nr:rhodanese-like domain-containing protein [Hyphomicrobiaceae bacterium]
MSAIPSSSPENVSVRSVWQRLTENADAVLIDVRTRAEWSYVGLPDLSAIGKQALLVEWQSFPDGRPNESFVDELAGQLSQLGTSTETELYFICRSGVRSLAAAQAMQRAGYTRCFNVAEGFEGPLDDRRHRGSRSGWKADGLPWVQG